MTAIVDAWLSPASWQFYGAAGARFLKCRGESGGREYVHFTAIVGRRVSHRIAIIDVEGDGK